MKGFDAIPYIDKPERKKGKKNFLLKFDDLKVVRFLM